MATERSHAAVGVLNGEVWVIGGIDSSGNTLSSCERLDAMTGTWISGPDMTMPRAGHGVVVLCGELWVVAWDCRTTERLDAAANRWVCGPDRTLTRECFAVAVFRGQLWVVGGLTERCKTMSSCEFLDVASNTWMAGGPMNTPRYCHSLAVLDGELWAVGGINRVEYLQSCERLDAATNVWVAGPRALPLKK